MLGAAAEAKKPKLKPEELVQLHLASLGSREAILARNRVVAEGTGTLTILRGGGGKLQGPAKLLSDGWKLRSTITFGNRDYPAEDLSFDGDEVYVGLLEAGRRSPLGEFIYQFPELIEEGLWAGVLSSGWALLGTDERQPRLKYEGLKKVDDVKYHRMNYRPKKGSDISIKLYFDEKSYQHRMTDYKVRVEGFAGRSGDRALQAVTRYSIRETFSGYQPVGDLTLPGRWEVDFTREIGMDITMLRWSTGFQTMSSDVPIDSSQFVLY
jgi:hypothetical protein